MKCPDCGTTLTAISISNLDKSARCFTCGGFWTEPSSVNRITAADVSKLPVIVSDKSSLRFGSDVCPTDSGSLERFVGESVPENVLVKRCKSCGFWWWPGDNLLRFKPAQEAKVNYFKHWGIASDLSALTLPVLVMGLLSVGLGIGLYSVSQRQQTIVGADVGVHQFSATYLGDGSELISFRAKNAVNTIEYKKTDDKFWQTAIVRNVGNDVYSARIEDLRVGENYVVRIANREFKFVPN